MRNFTLASIALALVAILLAPATPAFAAPEACTITTTTGQVRVDAGINGIWRFYGNESATWVGQANDFAKIYYGGSARTGGETIQFSSCLDMEEVLRAISKADCERQQRLAGLTTSGCTGF